MAKGKEKTKDTGSNKRKADGGEVAESSTKRPRREPPSPIVQLPHTPGGTVHAKPVKQSRIEDAASRSPGLSPLKPSDSISNIGIEASGDGEAVDDPPACEKKRTKRASKHIRALIRKQAGRANGGVDATKDASSARQPSAPTANGDVAEDADVAPEADVDKEAEAQVEAEAEAEVEAEAEAVSAVEDARESGTPASSRARRPQALAADQRAKGGLDVAASTSSEPSPPGPAPIVDIVDDEANDAEAGAERRDPKKTRMHNGKWSTRSADRHIQAPIKKQKRRAEAALASYRTNDVPEQAIQTTAAVTKAERKAPQKAECEAEEAQRADKAEAVGSAELDREVSMLDVEALTKRADAEADAMGISNATKGKQEPSWSLSPSAGGRFIDHDPIFARDPTTGEAVIIAGTQREIQVLSIETSLPIRTHAVRRGVRILGFALDPIDSENVHVVCDSGPTFVWPWTVDDSEPGALVHTGAKIVAGTINGDRSQVMFYLKDSGAGTAIWGSQSVYRSQERLDSLQILGEGEYIVAHGSSSLVLGMCKDVSKAHREYTWIEVPFSIAVTCMDARITHTEATSKKDKHGAQITLALGNAEGQIHLYDDITPIFAGPARSSLPAPRILHWHREAVSALKFSRDGNYLISGGKETVLVLWQLETGKKQFLPHLTSEIERIVVSPEGDRYAVQMGDNSVMVLSTSELKPVANFAGLQLAGAVPESARMTHKVEYEVENEKVAAAVLHPRHINQLLLAVPATQPKALTEAAEARPFLQTFDLRTSRHITRQALTRNNVTDFNLGPERTPIASPDAAHLAISHDGQFLATIDEWMLPANDVSYLSKGPEAVLEERLKRREVHLKFWRWDKGQGTWTLSTRFDAPHARAGKQTQGAGKVFALCCDPAAAGFATVGEDGRVRIWKPKTRVRHGVAVKGEGGVEVVEWVCGRTVELPAEGDGRADSPFGAEGTGGPSKASLAYSEDGSLLAVTQNFTDASNRPPVHFIDTSSGATKATKGGITAAHIEHVAFLDRYFITVVREAVHVWDLVTDTPQQRFHLPNGATRLAVNGTDGTFAVAVGSRVSVYKPTETRPLYKDDCGQSVAVVLAGKGRRGYALLFEDATVRTLASIGGVQRRALPTLAGAGEAPLAIEPAAEQNADVEMADILALPAPDAEERGLVFEEAEDDRPVVRPEQLASIFDVGQSFAMPSVKDMFEAVVGLYGRRPIAQLAAVSA